MDTEISRRELIQRAAGDRGDSVLRLRHGLWVRNDSVPASERITVATIGHGGRCTRVMPHFLSFKEAQFVAVSDVRRDRLLAGKAQVDNHYGNTDCAAYGDFRELLARDDVDAVFIATGDRWHSLISIMAARAKKDVYSEKPMSLTIEESRAVVETMKRYGTVYQCGHQRRSVGSYRFQTQVVQSGQIGKVHTVIAQNWENPVLKPDSRCSGAGRCRLRHVARTNAVVSLHPGPLSQLELLLGHGWGHNHCNGLSLHRYRAVGPRH